MLPDGLPGRDAAGLARDRRDRQPRAGHARALRRRVGVRAQGGPARVGDQGRARAVQPPRPGGGRQRPAHPGHRDGRPRIGRAEVARTRRRRRRRVPTSSATVVERVKEREAAGWSYEAADASFELLLRDELGRRRRDAVHRRVVPRHRRPARGRRDGQRGDGEGASPAASGSSPPRRATARSTRSTARCARRSSAAYPRLAELELTDYKVRIMPGKHGTDAVTRVLIETSDGAAGMDHRRRARATSSRRRGWRCTTPCGTGCSGEPLRRAEDSADSLRVSTRSVSRRRRASLAQHAASAQSCVQSAPVRRARRRRRGCAARRVVLVPAVAHRSRRCAATDASIAASSRCSARSMRDAAHDAPRRSSASTTAITTARRRRPDARRRRAGGGDHADGDEQQRRTGRASRRAAGAWRPGCRDSGELTARLCRRRDGRARAGNVNHRAHRSLRPSWFGHRLRPASCGAPSRARPDADVDALTVAAIDGHPFGADHLHRRPLGAAGRAAAVADPAEQGRRDRQELRRPRAGDGRRRRRADTPMIFLKPSTSVIGDGDAIRLPADSHEVHHEGELAVVIGTPGPQRQPPRTRCRTCSATPPPTTSPPATSRRADVPVHPGEGLRLVLPARPVDRDGARPVRPALVTPGQRRDQAGRPHQPDDPRHARADRVHVRRS